MNDDWGESGFVFDATKTDVPGIQFSVYWYQRWWRPLVSVNLWRYGLTVGWTDAGGSGLEQDDAPPLPTREAFAYDRSGTNDETCPRCGQPVEFTRQYPMRGYTEVVWGSCKTCGWSRCLSPLEASALRRGDLILHT